MNPSAKERIARQLESEFGRRSVSRATVYERLRQQGLNEADAWEVLRYAFDTRRLQRLQSSAPPPPPATTADLEDPCKRSVLLIEDDTQIRNSIEELLEDEGYDVTPARNGKEALRLLRTINQPCCILLDLMMPVMNGWEFYEILQEDEELSSVPVAVLTASQHPPEGATTLKKPIELAPLLNVIEDACRHRKSA